HRLEHCAHGRGQGRGQRRQHCGLLHAGLVSRLAAGNLLVAAAWPESQPRERLDAAMARGRRGQIPRARLWRRRTPHLWRPRFPGCPVSALHGQRRGGRRSAACGRPHGFDASGRRTDYRRRKHRVARAASRRKKRSGARLAGGLGAVLDVQRKPGGRHRDNDQPQALGMPSEAPHTLVLSPLGFVFSVVGTSRCDVRAAPSRRRSHITLEQLLEGRVGLVCSRTKRFGGAGACSGATRSHASAARSFVPPATTRAGTAQRAIPTIALNILFLAFCCAAFAADPPPHDAQLAAELHSRGWIVFSAQTPHGDWDLYLVRPDGSERRALTDTREFNEAGARFSPDGKRLLYYRMAKSDAVDNNTYGTFDLVLAESNGGNAVVYGRDFPWASW